MIDYLQIHLHETIVISLDHDLGLFTQGGKEHTGYEVLVFIERELAMGTATFTLPEIHIHSANAVGRRRMTQAVQSIKRLSGEEARRLKLDCLRVLPTTGRAIEV